LDLEACGVTLRLAFGTATILLVFGTPLAWILSRSRGPFRTAVEAVLSLPLVLPPTVLGFFLLVLLGESGVVGRLFEALGGRPPAFTFGGVLAASVVFNLPFALGSYVAAFDAVDRRFIEAAACAGASRLSTFFRVALPLARPGVASGTLLAFAHALGEFGVVLMVGGAIPGETRTLAIAVYDDVQALQFERATKTSLALLGASFLLLLSARILDRRTRR
jgi:molybdate transport system permease protein